MTSKKFFAKAMNDGGIGIVLALLCIIFGIITPHFATLNNIKNIFTQISINTTLAVGMTFVIIIAGIDLSVGSVMALASVGCAVVLKMEHIPEPIAIILGIMTGMALGALFGFFNGIISEKWQVPAFIVTLGMMGIARGVALYVTDARTIFNFPASFLWLGSGDLFWGTIPVIFIIAVILVLIGQFVLSKTVFGRYILAIGNNEESVRLSGIKTSFYKVFVYSLSGLTAGIAAITYMARMTIANPVLGSGAELNAIAAVIIGGTSLSGGRGSLIGTFFGACIIGVLTNGLILLGVSDFIRQIITGMVTILAVILDSYRQKMAKPM
jgi:ribose transport system permease protein